MPEFSRVLPLVAVAALGFTLAGCSADKINDLVQRVSVPPVMAHTSKELKGLSEEDRVSVVDLDTFKHPGDSETALQKARKKEGDRNSLQDILMMRSITKCTKFQKFIYAVHGTRKLGLSAVSLALSTAGTIFTGGTSQALSAASTGFQGFDKAYDAEILQQRSIALILQTIDTTRATKASEIAEKRDNKKFKDYGGDAAVRDVEEYHSLCSLTKALAKLGKAVQENEARKKTAKEKDKTIKAKEDTIKAKNETIKTLQTRRR